MLLKELIYSIDNLSSMSVSILMHTGESFHPGHPRVTLMQFLEYCCPSLWGDYNSVTPQYTAYNMDREFSAFGK